MELLKDSMMSQCEIEKYRTRLRPKTFTTVYNSQVFRAPQTLQHLGPRSPPGVGNHSTFMQGAFNPAQSLCRSGLCPVKTLKHHSNTTAPLTKSLLTRSVCLRAA
jgi:hypothetical protein